MDPLDPVAPDVLADLMLASALEGHVDLVAMRSAGDSWDVTVESDGKAVAGMRIPVEVGEAAAARLWSAARIHPQLGGGDGRGHVARITVRVGARTGAVVLSLGATAEGTRVEIQRLA